jgi:3-oxoacyl-[acyl-carrier protein] reductase
MAEAAQVKVAVVTGASRGIGRAIAERLAHDGHLVVVNYSENKSAADAAVKSISDSGGSAFALQADVGKLASIRAFYEALDSELIRRTGAPRFDVLVNNAGIAPGESIDQVSEELFDRVFAINVKGPFFMTQLGLSRLRDGGRIINVSSLVSRAAFPGYAAYAPTKGALNVFTTQQAAALGARGITVNAISPGPTDTDINAQWLRGNADAAKAVAGMTALGRVGQAADIAGVAAFLASADSAWVTGQYIEVSGGARL